MQEDAGDSAWPKAGAARKCGKKCRETMGLLPCEGVAIDAN